MDWNGGGKVHAYQVHHKRYSIRNEMAEQTFMDWEFTFKVVTETL